MDNRNRTRIWTLAAALLLAVPVAQGLTMKDTDASAPSCCSASPALRTTVNAVDLTMGYDPQMTRAQKEVQDPLYGTSETLAMTRDLMGAQLGVFRTYNGAYTIEDSVYAVSNGAATAATVRVIPAQGWFTSFVRSDPEVDSGQHILNVDASRFQPSAGESFKVTVTARGDGYTVGSTDLTCAGTREFNVFGGSTDGMTVNLRSQGGESMSEGTPESHRNEAIELVIKSHASLTGVRCKYAIQVSMNLQFAFEVRHDSLRGVLFPPDEPQPGSKYTDYIGLHSRIEVYGDGTHNPSYGINQPVNILYAPVLPARWICESLHNAPGGFDDVACIEAGAAEATSSGALFSAWRAAADDGYFLQAAYVVDGVTNVEAHFVADVGEVNLTDSLLYTVTGSGITASPWPT